MIAALALAGALAAVPECRDLAATPPSTDEPLVGTVQWTARLALLTWQVLLSPANGDNCAFYPTCSGYARRAVREHGAVRGAVMSFERINRNHAGWRYTPCTAHGRTYLYDPVSANDFWFREER